MADKQDALDGTLIRGADGTLYFIPRSDLDQYQVPDEVVDKVNSAVNAGSAPGVTFTDAELTPLVRATASDDEMWACEGLSHRPQ